MRAAFLLALLAALAGRCTPDRTPDGWPGQRNAFAKLCRWGVCFQ
jgi:hypothetical protein